jgi:hypothetical protein
MFSSQPSIASRSAATLDSLLYACTSVAEQCLYAVAEPATPAQFRAWVADEHGPGGWLRARVQFSGAVGGWLELIMPAVAVREWCGAFTGAAADAAIGDDETADFAAELVNIVCGAWLTQASGRRLFSLAVPGVTDVDESLVRELGTGDAAGVLYLRVNDVLVRVELHIETWEGA